MTELELLDLMTKDGCVGSSEVDCHINCPLFQRDCWGALNVLNHQSAIKERAKERAETIRKLEWIKNLN